MNIKLKIDDLKNKKETLENKIKNAKKEIDNISSADYGLLFEKTRKLYNLLVRRLSILEMLKNFERE
jgi:FtsZ-binding cell division protein ZapB